MVSPLQGGAPVRSLNVGEHKYYFTRVYGGYIELVIGIINQRSHHWGGTTLQSFAITIVIV